MDAIVERRPDSYQWKSGSKFKVDANTVGRHLEHLHEITGGHATVDVIANEAEILGSPIYELFEHDLETAAYEYHKARARHIANSIVIMTVIPAVRPETKTYENRTITIDLVDKRNQNDENGQATTVTTNAFVSIKQEGGQRAYVPFRTVVTQDMARKQYARRLYTELLSCAKKAIDFNIFCDLAEMLEAGQEQDVFGDFISSLHSLPSVEKLNGMPT